MFITATQGMRVAEKRGATNRPTIIQRFIVIHAVEDVILLKKK